MEYLFLGLLIAVMVIAILKAAFDINLVLVFALAFIIATWGLIGWGIYRLATFSCPEGYVAVYRPLACVQGFRP